MSFNRPATILILLLTATVLSPEADGFLTEKTLQLERGLPVKGVALDKLKARDLARAKAHNRRSLAAGVVDFPVNGAANPFTVGLYFARVKLGNPPKEFYVQIDTGSDILWVTCSGCSDCPNSSGLNIELEFFDPKKSSTASLIGCSDQKCSIAQNEGAQCTSDSSNSQCLYTFQYGDGSGTQGYYVSDTMYFDTVSESAQITNSSAPVMFGCSNFQSGDLMKPDRAVDGIFGFGQHELSVISQLSSAGVAPKVFSHCLKGSGNGGGILVLGEIVEPGIVYTPLVPSTPHYHLNLHSIAVNGQQLNIDSSAFTTSPTQGTIIDSGTTLALISEQVYDTFVNAIISSLQPSLVQSFDGIKDNRCFIAAGSVDDAFPPVTLNFVGGATMSLKASDYLLPQGTINSSDIIWCIGWQKSEGGTTILGDLVLKDKIVVYDLANQRIGWKNYDCSLSVNVSSSSGKSEFVNISGQQFDMSSSSSHTSNRLLPMSFIIFVVHVCVFIINLL